MATKRSHIDIDPDYEDVTKAQTKRQKVLEDDAKESTRKKIEMIVRKQFHQELKNKEKELDCIDQSLRHSQMMVDRLRACIIANYYGSASQQRFVKGEPQQSVPIHPAVKDTLGKRPLNTVIKTEPKVEQVPSSTERLVMKQEPGEQTETKERSLIKEEPSYNEITSRADRFKVKKRIVIGNVSKYIPVDRRDENDQSTHKWMVYVRGPKGEPNIDHFVKKVWFFLHPSYRPNDLVEVLQPPFHLTRRGWGEFPVRVQLYFTDPRNKRVDVIHQLKLDRTYTGLQTLGSETVIDVELEKEIEVKPQVKTLCNGPYENHIAMETNITIPEYVSPIKKEIKQEILSPGSANSRTPNKNLSKQNISKSVSQFSPTGQHSNMTLTLGTLGSLTSHGINKSGTSEGQNGTPINGLKQKAVQSSPSGADDVVSKHSSELQKMLLQSTPPSGAKTSSTAQSKVQTTQTANSAKASSSPVISVNAGKVNSQVTKSLQMSATVNQPAVSGQISLPATQLSSASSGNPAQTLYIRCKDNQGNIFLVPHHLLKTVPGTPVVNQSVNAQPSKTTAQSPKTSPNKAAPQKQGSIIQTENLNKTVSSSPSKTPLSGAVVQPILVNQAVTQQPVAGKAVFQKPTSQNSPLLIRPPGPVTKSSMAPAPGVPSPVLLIKTEVSPVRPMLATGQPIKMLDKNGKEVPQPSQLQLHLQGQISQNQLKVTSQGLKSVQPAGKTKVSKQMETVTLVQKSDSNLENKIPSKTCQLASLLKGDISAAHRNAVKQVSLVTGVNTTSAQVLASQNMTQNILVQKPAECSKDVSSSSGGIKVTKNSTHSSTSVNQAIKLQQTTVGVAPQAISISAPSRTMHSVILVNQDVSKVPVFNQPARTMTSTVAPLAGEVVGQSPSPRSVSAGGQSSTVLATAPAHSAKQQTIKNIENSTGLAGKEPMKTVIAKIGTQTLLLQLPVSDSGIMNKPVEVPKQSKPPPKKPEVPSNAALIETLKKQAAEKEAQRKAAAVLSYRERKLGCPVKLPSDGEKRIHKWKKKTHEENLLGMRRFQEDHEPVKAVDPLRVENYPDIQSLVRAAIKRHPVVSSTANVCQHPYCARTSEQWLSWNVGKRRASEWQRAAACHRYLKSLLNGNQFKGNQLWSVKQIVCWCRLHAYSPHYMEKTLHPTGVDFPVKNMRTGVGFSSATDSNDTVIQVDDINQKYKRESFSDEDVDIVSTDLPVKKIKEEAVEESTTPTDLVTLPSSNTAQFVHDLTQKIGVRFDPAPVLEDVYGSAPEEMIFKAMLSFVEDIITESFSIKVNMGRYPDGVGVADVYRALSRLPQADFLTNKHLGVKDLSR